MTLRIIAPMLFMVSASVASAAAFNTGVAACDRGDCAAALVTSHRRE